MKAQLQSILNAYETSPKKYIVGIDVGSTNMGLAVIDRTRLDEPPMTEKSNILRRKNGKQYSKYNEKRLYEYIHAWIGERWNSVFSKALIVGIEKQMTGNVYNETDRRCLLIETAFTCYFRERVTSGGPLFIVVGPSAWKRQIGIKVGDHVNTGTDNAVGLDVVRGSTYSHFPAYKQYNPNYRANKVRAVNRFDEIYRSTNTAEGEFFRLAVKHNPKLIHDTDMKEALMFACAIKLNLHAYLIEACKSDNFDVIDGNGKIRRSTLSKIAPFKKFEEYDLAESTINEVLEEIEEMDIQAIDISDDEDGDLGWATADEWEEENIQVDNKKKVTPKKKSAKVSKPKKVSAPRKPRKKKVALDSLDSYWESM